MSRKKEPKESGALAEMKRRIAEDPEGWNKLLEEAIEAGEMAIIEAESDWRNDPEILREEFTC